MPYRANVLSVDSYWALYDGDFKETKRYFEEAMKYDTPFSFLSVRIMLSWETLSILYFAEENPALAQDPYLKDLYSLSVSELEEVKNSYSYNPQIYYVLGAMYRSGSIYFGKNALEEAKRVLKESLNYSEFRTDYYQEYAQVLLELGKYKEAEELVQDYVNKTGRDDPFVFVTLGHLSFIQNDYGKAMEYYNKAEEKGYLFTELESDYNRYLLTAQELGDYRKIATMALKYLENKKDYLSQDNLAKTYYNLALGYLNLGEKEKALDFFLKAVELNKEYEQFRPFYENS